MSKHRLVTRVLGRLESMVLKSHLRVAFSRWFSIERSSQRVRLESVSNALRSLQNEVRERSQASNLRRRRFRVMMWKRSCRLLRQSHLSVSFNRWSESCRQYRSRDEYLSHLASRHRHRILLYAWRCLEVHTQTWRSIESREFRVRSTIEKIEDRFKSIQTQANRNRLALAQEKDRVRTLEKKCVRLEKETETYRESAKLALESQRNVFNESLLVVDDDYEEDDSDGNEDDGDPFVMDMSIMEKGELFDE